ncbi:pyruvate dehydrogenase (acetyl-transferring) E1 component subunit alpha [Candidimonas nitroreducens]|uniref:2-oxoisovalerate dehydrogenase subunit alpha n=2 Tax=Candidimonas nitroreducens TaxID=683354 RepID=A0A225MLK8_9BURK|nr:pyruvate dehydrogenase (acetyl-transferring) E1 component subunit alpha [Candidimonas nitroreducens]
MIVCREFESALCAANPRWFSTEGEEAVLVGAFAALEAGDIGAPHYRGPFVAYLMRGADMKTLACQAFGKAAGYNKGRSVPFTGPPELGFVPWVAGDLGSSLGIATGAALALQRTGSGGKACICSFGDGTANRGDFHENLNIAGLWKLPIVYVCQNNGWAISQHVQSYLPAPVVERAAAYGMPGVTVDGNDVQAVYAAVAAARHRAAKGEGPTLIEAMTWRKGGHWSGDKALYKDAAQRAYAAPDPIELLKGRLIRDALASEDALENIRGEAAEQARNAVAEAQTRSDAGATELGEHEVFA